MALHPCRRCLTSLALIASPTKGVPPLRDVWHERGEMTEGMSGQGWCDRELLIHIRRPYKPVEVYLNRCTRRGYGVSGMHGSYLEPPLGVERGQLQQRHLAPAAAQRHLTHTPSPRPSSSAPNRHRHMTPCSSSCYAAHNGASTTHLIPMPVIGVGRRRRLAPHHGALQATHHQDTYKAISVGHSRDRR